MKGIINLVVAGLCAFTLFYHFKEKPLTETLFGFEVSNPIFYLFWGICLFGSLSSFYKANKKPKL